MRGIPEDQPFNSTGQHPPVAQRVLDTRTLPSACATRSPCWFRHSPDRTVMPASSLGFGILSVIFHVEVNVSPGRTGNRKRQLCSRYAMAVAWKYIPMGALMSADVQAPCKMRPPKRVRLA